MKIEDYWGIVYAIMKSLNINELEIDKKYFEIDYNTLINIYYHNDLKGNIKIELKEKEQMSSMEYRV